MWGVRQMNSMKLNKVVFFDLDGVILNTETIYLKLMLEYNIKLDMAITKEYYIKNLLGKTKREISNYLSEKFKNKFEYNNYWKGLEEIRRNYLLNNKIEIKQGFFELMDFLKKNNYNFGIVTSNSKALAIDLLKNSGLNISDFNFIISREDVVNTKPAPDLYYKAMNNFKLKKQEYIAIEDSNVGIKSALSAGIKVINIKDIDIIELDLKTKCIATLKSLEEVIGILKEMK